MGFKNRKRTGTHISFLLSCGLHNYIFTLDPLLTQNGIGTGKPTRKQRKIHRTNGGKKGKSEPKRLRFALETTYGPEGRGFESLTAYQKSSKSSDFEDFCFS